MPGWARTRCRHKNCRHALPATQLLSKLWNRRLGCQGLSTCMTLGQQSFLGHQPHQSSFLLRGCLNPLTPQGWQPSVCLILQCGYGITPVPLVVAKWMVLAISPSGPYNQRLTSRWVSHPAEPGVWGAWSLALLSELPNLQHEICMDSLKPVLGKRDVGQSLC